eukprot:4126495-Pleurochrysis_carterae.AAC.1
MAPSWVSGRCDEVFVVLGASPLEGTATGCGEVASDEPLWEGTARVVRGGASRTRTRADIARQQEA